MVGVGLPIEPGQLRLGPSGEPVYERLGFRSGFFLKGKPAFEPDNNLLPMIYKRLHFR